MARETNGAARNSCGVTEKYLALAREFIISQRTSISEKVEKQPLGMPEEKDIQILA